MTASGAGRDQRIAALGYDYRAQPKQTVPRCNLCGGSAFLQLTHRDRYGYPAQASGCRTCGLVFLNPVMSRDAYSNFYRHTYRPLVSAFHGRLIDARTIQAEQRIYARDCASFLAPFMNAGKRESLLDIGGSTGVVASHLSAEFGLKATVLDPAPLEIAEARRLGLETVTAFAEDFDAGGRRFDVVTLCQTIDHLLDVSATLAMVRRVLAPGGLLFVDIVDLRAAYLRTWSVEEAIKIDHPYYLTDMTTVAYLRRSGFAIAASTFAADHLHLGYACRAATLETSYLPDPAAVDEQWREIRFVQNAPRPA